jgi:hypothetical protein
MHVRGAGALARSALEKHARHFRRDVPIETLIGLHYLVASMITRGSATNRAMLVRRSGLLDCGEIA